MGESIKQLILLFAFLSNALARQVFVWPEVEDGEGGLGDGVGAKCYFL